MTPIRRALALLALAAIVAPAALAARAVAAEPASRLRPSFALSLAPVAGARTSRQVARPSLCDTAPGGGYPWPVRPFDRQHPVRGNLGDPRTVFRTATEPELGAFSFHNGVDIAAWKDTRVYPVLSGTVRYVSGHEVIVATDEVRIFQYWHITPRVRVGQHVLASRTVLGSVEARRGHVHLSEIVGGVVRNPLGPGHLAPYRDGTAPSVDALFVRDAGGRTVDAGALRGRVDLVVRATDAQSLRVPGPWGGLPVTPAVVSWRLVAADGTETIPEQSVVDFRASIPQNSAYHGRYADGTYQNFPALGKRYLFGTPGDFLFRLTPGLFDTRTVPPGRYTLTVTAADTCGNTGTLSAPLAIEDQPGSVHPEAPQPWTTREAPSVPRPRALTAWPAGTAGYTIVLASIPAGDGLESARALARRARAAGLKDVGILRSGRHPNLRPGFLVVFAGVYGDAGEASRAAGRASAAYPGAYPREIGAPVAVDPAAATRPATARRPARRGPWAVVLASVALDVGRDGMERALRAAREARLPAVRIVDSSRFRTLRRGYWVLVTGRYPTEAAAFRTARRLWSRYPEAYPRKLTARRLPRPVARTTDAGPERSERAATTPVRRDVPAPRAPTRAELRAVFRPL